MKLERLHISRVPGIDQPFTVDSIGPGINVIVGPNAVGKSSLCRTVRALLWADVEAPGQTSAWANFAADGKQWRVSLDGARHRWESDSGDVQLPALPAPHLQNCFFLELRDLLELSDNAGHEFAAQIRHQMAGGFDLDRVAKDFDHIASIGRKERKRLDDAAAKIREGERKQRQLIDDEAGLGRLEAQLLLAREAHSDVRAIDEALALANWSADLSDKNAELAEMPAVIGKLSGHELDQLKEKEEELEKKQGELSTADSDLEDAANIVKESPLAEPIDDTVLEVWSGKAEKLSSLEQDLKTLETAQEGLEAAVREAANLLCGRAEAVPHVDVHSATELYRFLREAQSNAATEKIILERLDLIGDSAFSADDDARLDLLRGASESLRSWMRSLDPAVSDQAEAQTKRRNTGLVVAALAIVLGLVGTVWSPFLSALIGLGLGVGAATFWFGRSNQAPAGQRQAAETQFPAGLDGPEAWTVPAVVQRLRTVEDEVAELEVARRQDSRNGQERGQLEKRLEPIAAEKEMLEERRHHLAAQLNLQELLSDADLVDTLTAVNKVRQTLVAEHDGRGRLEAIRIRVESCRDALAAELHAYGYSSAGDAIDARAQIKQLDVRSAALRQASAAVAVAQASIRTCQSAVDDCTQNIDGIYQTAGLPGGDKAGLTRLMDQIETFQKLRGERDGLLNNVRQSTARLKEIGIADLAGLSVEELNQKREKVEEQIETIEPLVGEITEIETKVRIARSAHDQENAVTEHAEALSALQEVRDVAIRAAAGRFLLDSIKQEHETTQMPRVLERARELFALFTHQLYDLRLAPDENKSFIAVETHTGERRLPDQLSDGTRAQLLVAVRLAFAEDAEQGDTLPLFLDEALDHADPQRFRAMVQSLGKIADEGGRQIFYLTNDPADVRRIEITLAEDGATNAHMIDLGMIRNQAASIDDEATLAVEPVPSIPRPEPGEESTAYAARLRVPNFDPVRGANWQHLYYLTWDDSALLHRCLSAGIERVGQWRMLGAQNSPASKAIIADHASAAQLAARASSLEAYCAAWQEGRGRRVPWEVIEGSGGVSKTFLERVAELLDEVDGDGFELVQILKLRSDSRVQGFRAASAEAIERALIEAGYIDEREILDESDVLTRVLSTPAVGELPADVIRECVHRWWRYGAS